MDRTSTLRRVGTFALGVAGIAGLVALTSVSFAQSTGTGTKPRQPAAPAVPPPDMQLPPGMTAEDMEAFGAAATPGPMQAHLFESIGTWNGKTTHWMGPGAPPMTSECTAVFSELMKDRFVKMDLKAELPGMGTMEGFGIYGFDNVSKKFQSTWCDTMGTGMMFGTGTLSPDGKVMTWEFNYTCPITKKPSVMREVDTTIDKNTTKLEMFAIDPKSGKEFKNMEVLFTRVPTATATGSAR